MSEPLVSVLMITYNHEPYIAKAIESVLAQKTDFPFELVIGEDCSKDATRSIVLDYARRYPDIIRPVISEQNVGARANEQRTLKATRGKYIAFCEGDDYWQNPLKLQKQADYLESHSDCEVVYSDYDIYHLSDQTRIENYIVHQKITVPERITIPDIIYDRCGILTCAVMISRSLYLRIIEADPFLHQNDYFPMGDRQLWSEASVLTRIGYLPESMATHVILFESASRSRNFERWVRFKILCCELYIYLFNKYGYPEERKQYESKRIEYQLLYAYRTRNAALAEEMKSLKGTLSRKELLLYYGAKYGVVHYANRLAAFILKLFRNPDKEWR